jgi:peptide-methionine (S)-S-oxide reductase
VTDDRREQTVLGGGCFWCLEAVYQEVRGVERVVSGYAGGQVTDPDYREVCTGTTGHAEVVRLTYDPDMVSFRDLLEIFFTIHDPTQINRQGADVGTQYRSVILYATPGQKATAESLIAELEREAVYDRPIVTEVVPLDSFYPAEAYHQDYYKRNTGQSYCQIVVAPKLARFREKHAALRG